MKLSTGCHYECSIVDAPSLVATSSLSPGTVAGSPLCAPRRGSKLPELQRGRLGVLATRRPVGQLGLDLAGLDGSTPSYRR